jgi:hypothetical protein
MLPLRERGADRSAARHARIQRVGTSGAALSKSSVLSHPDRIVIATRQSRLALWQAEHVRELLRGLYPDCRVELLALSTRGDEILDTSLAKIGGKGLFVKELELALADGRADLAVHSAKDVPMDLPAGFALGAMLSARTRAMPSSPTNSMLWMRCPRAPWSAHPACGARHSFAAAIRSFWCQACAAVSTPASPSWTAAITTPSSSPLPASSGWGWARVFARCSRSRKAFRRRAGACDRFRAERGDLASLAALNHRATELAVRANAR